MKAYVLNGINDLSKEETKVPEVTENSVLIHMKAAGICGSDIPRIYKTGAHVHPIIPGHEFSGVVVKTFDNKDAGMLGKAVGIFPLIPCMKCPMCQKKHYEMCRSYSYLGSRCDGGFAEYAVVPKWNIIDLPPNVSMKSAALLEPLSVAVHAVRRLQKSTPADSRIVVIGLGTIGLMIVATLISEGYENVRVIGNKDLQKNMCLALGLSEDRYTDLKTTDLLENVLEKTGGGADVVFECAGRNNAVATAVEIAAPTGRIIYVSNPESDIVFPKNVYWKILRNQLEIKGTWNSSFTHEEDDDWHFALKLLSEKRVDYEKLITHEFSLNDLEKGLDIMKNKTDDYIKIMIVNE